METQTSELISTDIVPTLFFRWLVKKNVVTAKQIRDYAISNDCQIDEARKILVNAKPPILQQKMIGNSGETWVEVAVVIAPSPLEKI